MTRRTRMGGLVTAALLCCSCAHAVPPPAPPPPPPPAPPPPPVAEPAPPKCEALTEACVATASSRMHIHPSTWTLAPPVGWTYAQEADSAVVVAPNAALAITAYQRGKKHSDTSARDEAFARVSDKLAVSFVGRKKIRWPKKADEILSVGSMKITLYQMDDATRETKKGPLLVFTAPLLDGEELLGIGFVPAEDASDADQAILTAIKSLAPAAEEEVAHGEGATPP